MQLIQRRKIKMSKQRLFAI